MAKRSSNSHTAHKSHSPAPVKVVTAIEPCPPSPQEGAEAEWQLTDEQANKWADEILATHRKGMTRRLP